MKYTRNSDQTYYYTHCCEVNCGSYALRLNEWYDPETYFEDTIESDIEDWIVDMGEKGFSDLEISNMFSDILVEGMLLEFKGELELCDGFPPETDKIELIAFNTFCCYDDNCVPNYDFHFRVLRDGVWMEKCGAKEVCECDEYDWGEYIGEVIYLYHWIK